MQEAVISQWLVRVGDTVTEGQPLVRIESDKVEAEVEAPANGTVAELLVDEGATAQVGAVIARIDA